jgi:pimeloyl-ACP methyl ester carboxylesterase
LALDAYRRCRERLSAEGFDLSAYNSAASAADLVDLLRVFGYPPANLYGVSYGTRLALTVLRDYPEAVRSAVLDSVLPPDQDLYADLAANAERAFNAFFDQCAADAGCPPDLKRTFYELVDRLNANPISLALNNGEQALLDGNLLIDVLFVGLYNPAVTARMPGMITGIRDGERSEYDLLRSRIGLYFDTSTAFGMQLAVQCSEEIPFGSIQEAFNRAQAVQPQIAAVYPASFQALYEGCPEWNSTPPNPRENQPVTSSVPSLLLAGSIDPITPPAWGRAASAALSQSYFYEFPGHGHWVTRSSPCALDMALAFWEDPFREPAGEC